jgi:very-short-patch-repair endonuclease
MPGGRICLEGCTCGRHGAYAQQRRSQSGKAQWNRMTEAERTAKVVQITQGRKCPPRCTCDRHSVKRRETLRQAALKQWEHLSDIERIKMTEAAKAASLTRLELLGIKIVEHARVERWEVDAFAPMLNTVFECDGDYWHSLPEVAESDRRKNEGLAKRGYHLVRVWEKELRSDPVAAIITKLLRGGK